MIESRLHLKNFADYLISKIKNMKQQISATTETRTKCTTIADFSGHTIYVGIDVHKKDWQVACVFGELVLSNFRMTGTVQNVIDHLRKRYPGAVFQCV